MRAPAALVVASLLLAACDPEPAAPSEPSPEDSGEPVVEQPADYEPLSDGRLLRRLSLDLRGTLPGLDELDAVEADAGALQTLPAAWMTEPAFEERLVTVLGERFHTQVDALEAHYYDYGLDETEEYAFLRAVGEEPLRIMARTVVEDRPWTDVVTSDQTMANELLASIWQLEGYPEGGTGWHPVSYTDERPGIGVLSSNGLWWRYTTTAFNENRMRASTIVRLLMCEDLLARPVSFEDAGELLDAEDTSAMVRTLPACLSCHATVEPLAASLFGFYWIAGPNAYEMERYHPAREAMGPLQLEVEPAWFGTPMTSLADLGPLVAADPRFASCAVDHFGAALLRRELDLADEALKLRLTEDFQRSGYRVQPLLLSVVATEEYAAAGLVGSEHADPARVRTARMLTAQQLGSAVEELTGFRWTWEGWDLMQSDPVGYRVLAAGVDGRSLQALQHDPSVTWALVVQRLAQAASDHVVAAELEAEGEVESTDRRLFRELSLEDRPGDAAFEAQLVDLHRRLFGETPDAERIADLVALWEAIEAQADAREAWRGLLEALLRDPAFLTY